MARAVWFLIASTLTGCSTGDDGAAYDEPPRLALSFVADFNIPFNSTFEALGGAELGGISAISYDTAAERWLALSDARVSSRLYELSVVLDDGELDVRPVRSAYLTGDGGERFAANVLDPEGMAQTPWGTLVVATEADARADPVHQSRLLEFELDGSLVRELDVPEKFVVAGRPPDKGVRHNLAFESLTLSPSGRRLFLGVEQTLLQDGPEATFERPGFCRIVVYQVSASTREIAPGAEYVYPLGPVPRVAGLSSDVELAVGLVELVAVGDSRLLALERDFIRDRADAGRALNRVRVFVVDTIDATDVSAVAKLDGETAWRPVTKELLLDLDDIVPRLSPEFPSLDNFEAMGVGPALPDGGQSLLLVSDDNFRETQRSAFLLFSLTVEEP